MIGARSATHLGAQNGAVAFATTHWSVVLEAQSQSPAAQEALEKLCRPYWRPVYSFIRRQGTGSEEAEDLTQGFFALLLERRDLETVRKEKGRLRTYLLVSLKHFLRNERYRASTIKRGEGRRLVPLDALGDYDGKDLAPTNTLSADQIYERRWALTVLEEVLARLGDSTTTTMQGTPRSRTNNLAGWQCDVRTYCQHSGYRNTRKYRQCCRSRHRNTYRTVSNDSFGCPV